MPLYSYTCPSCGMRCAKQRPVLERDAPVLCHHPRLRSFGAPALMRRDIAAPDFHLKGPGWASTGYQ